MRVFDAAGLLDVWEQGQRQSLLVRALALLDVADVHRDEEALLALPMGRRDAHLLDIRERLFGPSMAVVMACPACGDALEASVALADLRVGDSGETEFTIDHAGFRATLRQPASADLIAIATGEREQARARLLTRCILAVEDRDGHDVPIVAMPGDLVDAIVARMAEADPQADMQLALSCPQCGHAWNAPFDIAAFLWRELDAWARRTLGDVHELARAYGWREQDVLSLTPARRQVYLELARQ